MTHYAALDVSLRSVAICIIDNEGEIRLETPVPSEVEAITEVLQGFDGDIVCVGLEAGNAHPIPHLWPAVGRV